MNRLGVAALVEGRQIEFICGARFPQAQEVYRSNVIEEEGSAVSAAADGWYEIPVGRYEIVTLGMK